MNAIEVRKETFREEIPEMKELSVPHYITWNPVETKQPDYHRPEYFGLLKFF